MQDDGTNGVEIQACAKECVADRPYISNLHLARDTAVFLASLGTLRTTSMPARAHLDPLVTLAKNMNSTIRPHCVYALTIQNRTKQPQILPAVSISLIAQSLRKGSSTMNKLA